MEVAIWALLNFLGLQIESFVNRNFGDIFEEGAARVIKYLILGLNYIAILKANLVGILGSEKTMTLTSILYNSGSILQHILQIYRIKFSKFRFSIAVFNNAYLLFLRSDQLHPTEGRLGETKISLIFKLTVHN